MLVVAKPQGDIWTPVLGGEVLFAPIDRGMMRRARRAALATLDREDSGSDADAAEQLADLGDALSYQLIVAGTKDWRNVREMVDGDDTGEGVELPFSSEALEAALSDPLIFEAFDAAYVQPFATRERERATPGNGFAASPNGIGEAAMREPITAASAAVVSNDVALPARTGSKRRKPTKKRTSGAS